MAYNKIQFIAYQIGTGPAKKDGKKVYLGNADTDKDIKKRCEIMKNAIQVARGSSKIDPSAKTLKLFMAPEFYFRGRGGAYPLEKVSLISETMRELTSKSSNYQHWLFVYGTALGSLDAVTPSSNAAKEIFNVALVMKGSQGAEAEGSLKEAEKSSLLVYKEYISHIDFLDSGGTRTQGRVDGQVERLTPVSGARDTRVAERLKKKKKRVAPKINPTGRGAEKSKTGLGGQSIFTMHGITFGLEVCLDHAEGRLGASLAAKGDRLVQVHLVPSAGMDIEPNNVVCIREGYAFNVDGMNTDNEGQRGHTELLKLEPNGQDLTDIQPADTVRIALQGSRSWSITHENYFQDPGVIRVFNSLKLPAARRRA